MTLQCSNFREYQYHRNIWTAITKCGEKKIFECQCDYHFRRAVSRPNWFGQLIEDTPLQLWETLGVDKIANIFCMLGSAQLNNQTNLIWGNLALMPEQELNRKV